MRHDRACCPPHVMSTRGRHPRGSDPRDSAGENEFVQDRYVTDNPVTLAAVLYAPSDDPLKEQPDWRCGGRPWETRSGHQVCSGDALFWTADRTQLANSADRSGRSAPSAARTRSRRRRPRHHRGPAEPLSCTPPHTLSGTGSQIRGRLAHEAEPARRHVVSGWARSTPARLLKPVAEGNEDGTALLAALKHDRVRWGWTRC